MRLSGVVFFGLVWVSMAAFADGPADRQPTDPHAVASATQAGGVPLPVEALLTTTYTRGFAHSHDGRKLAYISDATGRPNLWIMNADGSGAQQLIQNNDRQSSVRFTHDDAQVVYNQDRGGNEYYDIYVVPVSGGEPRNLTNTPDVSETVREFSPDGKLLAIGIKQRTSPSTNLGVMEWPGGVIRQLTHETDPNASWTENAWGPDGKFIYATRSVGLDDSDMFRVDSASGKAEKP